MLIGHNRLHVRADLLLDMRLDDAGRGTRNVREAQFAATLYHAKYNVFFLARLATVATAYHFAADIGFVNFHDASERGLVFLHGLSDSVAEMPSRPVIHAKMPLHLARGNALLCFTDDCQRQKPLF